MRRGIHGRTRDRPIASRRRRRCGWVFVPSGTDVLDEEPQPRRSAPSSRPSTPSRHHTPDHRALTVHSPRSRISANRCESVSNIPGSGGASRGLVPGVGCGGRLRGSVAGVGIPATAPPATLTRRGSADTSRRTPPTTPTDQRRSASRSLPVARGLTLVWPQILRETVAWAIDRWLAIRRRFAGLMVGRGARRRAMGIILSRCLERRPPGGGVRAPGT